MATGKILYKSMYWKIFQLFTSFIINVILARLFRAEVAAGFYSLVYLLSLCTGFFTLGLDIGLNYYLTRNRISAQWASTIILTVTGIALMVSLPLIGAYYRTGFSMGSLLFFSGCHIAGVLLATLSGTIFTAYGRNHEQAMVAFFVNLVLAVFAGLAAGVLHREHAIVYVFYIYFSFSFLQGVILFIMAWRRYGRVQGEGRDRPPFREIIRFSFGAFITNFIFFLAAKMCIYLLPYRVLPGPRGNYIQAYKIVEYLSLGTAFLYYPFITLVAGGDGSKVREKVLFLVRLSNTMVLLCVVIILAVGRWLFPLVFGNSFDGMYGDFCWLIPGLFAACSSTFFTAWYFGRGLVRVNLISACIQLVTVVLFFFLFTGYGNVHGAALAFSLSGLFSMAYDVLVFSREGRLRGRDLLLAGGGDWRVIRAFVLQLLKRQ